MNENDIGAEFRLLEANRKRTSNFSGNFPVFQTSVQLESINLSHCVFGGIGSWYLSVRPKNGIFREIFDDVLNHRGPSWLPGVWNELNVLDVSALCIERLASCNDISTFRQYPYPVISSVDTGNQLVNGQVSTRSSGAAFLHRTAEKIAFVFVPRGCQSHLATACRLYGMSGLTNAAASRTPAFHPGTGNSGPGMKRWCTRSGRVR